jgi:DNA-binding beta-propeller fold protein YncE
MKRFFMIALIAVTLLAMVGCVSGPPAMDSFEKDQGIVMPYLMFGDKTEGEHDSEAYLFDAPKPIGADSQGNIYVGGKKFLLTKYTSDGEFVKILAERGDEDGQINYVKGIACNSMDYVYATDSINKRINVFDADGNWLRSFGEEGSGPGQFSDIGPITIDADDNLYVSDDDNGVVVFDKNDNYIKNIGVKGEAAGQTSEFGWLATDADLRQLYVAVDGLGKIDVYDMDTGELKFDMGGLGNGPGMWEEDIEGLAVGPWGLVFAMDEAGGNIKVFQGDGTFVTQWGGAGLYEGELASSESIAYDPTNRRIVVADEKNYRVQVFSLDALGF